uniref:Uncharacterized protein n=1 Tax=Arundo donax TaxID=35708 RepID=A0A0A8YI07_ARUDO
MSTRAETGHTRPMRPRPAQNSWAETR